MNSFSWITRSSFAWVSRWMLPISSKKIEPPSATSKSPRLLAIAPVKAPLHVAEEVALQEIRRHASPS